MTQLNKTRPPFPQSTRRDFMAKEISFQGNLPKTERHFKAYVHIEFEIEFLGA